MQIYNNLSLDNLDGEEWKAVAIPGYENKYLCSNLGRIKSLPKKVTLFHGGVYFTKEKIIKLRLSDGYLFVALFSGKNENRLDIQAHRVIALTWLPNPLDKKEVNHRFGDKLDNRVSELEWATRKENIQHGYDYHLYSRHQTGKFGLNHIGAKKVQCTATGKIMCVKEAAEFMQVSRSHMSSMLKNQRTNWTTFIYV